MIFVKNVQKETLISLFLRYKLFRKKKAKCFEFNLIIFMRHIKNVFEICITWGNFQNQFLSNR